MDMGFPSMKGMRMGGEHTVDEHEHAGQIPHEPLYSVQGTSDVSENGYVKNYAEVRNACQGWWEVGW